MTCRPTDWPLLPVASSSAPVPLIVFAVPEETKAFLKRIRPGRKQAGEKERSWLRLADRPTTIERCWPTLRVLTTGMGTENARAAFEASCQAARPSLVLTCGFAGGLNPRLAAGAIVLQGTPVGRRGPAKRRRLGLG